MSQALLLRQAADFLVCVAAGVVRFTSKTLRKKATNGTPTINPPGTKDLFADNQGDESHEDRQIGGVGHQPGMQEVRFEHVNQCNQHEDLDQPEQPPGHKGDDAQRNQGDQYPGDRNQPQEEYHDAQDQQARHLQKLSKIYDF